MNKNITFIILFILIRPVAQCQQKIDTDRPDQTESVFTVPKHWLQFEAGFSKQQNSISENEFYLPTILTKYGVTKKLEFRLITSFQANTIHVNSAKQNESGFAVTEIGAKISLWEEKKLLPKTSIIFHVGVPPLSAKKYRPENVPVNFRFTMQHSVSNKISIGYNAGAEWSGENNNTAWVYTFTTGLNINANWYSYIEAFGEVSAKELPQHNIDGGIAYTIGNDIKIDLSSGFGISSAAPIWYIAAGFSMRLQLR